LYGHDGEDDVNGYDILGLRPLTAEEQSALTQIRQLQAAAANDIRYKGLADKIGSFIQDFTAKVAAIPVGTKDPVPIGITSTSITIWNGQGSTWYRGGTNLGQVRQDISVNGLQTLSKETTTTCSYFVADVLQKATGEELGKRGFLGLGHKYPPLANDYSTPNKDARLKDFTITPNGQMGDVISFPHPGDSGHVGIYLGYDIYISARTGDGPGTTGLNPVQPSSGIQIKDVPIEDRHVIIHFKN
jgi:hypothetical protein